MFFKQYLLDSSKPYLVFLHGWGQDHRSWDSLVYYCKLFSNCLVVDLPGFGNSKVIEPLIIDDYVKAIKKLLDSLKIKDYYLVGHSFGGKIIGFYGLKYQQKKCVLIAPSVFKGKKKLKTKLRIRLNKIYARFKILKRFVKYSDDYKNAEGVMKKTFLNVVNQYLSENQIKKLDGEILIIGFKNDQSVRIKTLEKLNKLCLNSQLKVYSKSHFAFQEKAYQISQDIYRFIKEQKR